MMRKKIDEVANLWNKTKDPKYKDLWYKYIKEYVNGVNNSNRRDVPSHSSDKTNDGRIELFANVNCFDLCDILRIKLSIYAGEPLNAHVMNDGSGDFLDVYANRIEKDLRPCNALR